MGHTSTNLLAGIDFLTPLRSLLIRLDLPTACAVGLF
jgi:hypothetical protein